MSILQAIHDSNAELKSSLVKHLACDRTNSTRKGLQTLSTEKQNAFSAVSGDITSRIRVDNEDHARILILNSLYFQQIEERRLQIHPAHQKTCRWVFKKPDEGMGTKNNLRAWVRRTTLGHGSKTRWNPPGSIGYRGRLEVESQCKITASKSTSLVTDDGRLMRFIYEAQDTKLAARAWSKDLPLLTAGCFFWQAGTEIQKSLHGLLRSLVHDLLRQATGLIPSATPSRWRAATLGFIQQPWTNTELETTLLELLRNGSRDYRFCIFVDGLDEFEGDHRHHSDLVEFLVRVSSSKGVKLCVSSRPYPVFKSGFADFPKLRMELLTRRDIETFAVDQLGKIKEFGALKAAHPATCHDVMTEIVDKAQGVILWVYLVIRSLKQGLVEGDSIAALVVRLGEIPPDLDEFFYRILERTPIHQRHYAAAYFQMVVESCIGSLSLMTFWLFQEEAGLDFLATTPVEPLPKKILRSRHLMLTRRVEGRCSGLLEVQRPRSEAFDDTPAEYTVEYLHRSVKDFLLSEPAQKLLVAYLNPTFGVPHICVRLR